MVDQLFTLIINDKTITNTHNFNDITNIFNKLWILYFNKICWQMVKCTSLVFDIVY